MKKGKKTNREEMTKELAAQANVILSLLGGQFEMLELGRKLYGGQSDVTREGLDEYSEREMRRLLKNLEGKLQPDWLSFSVGAAAMAEIICTMMYAAYSAEGKKRDTAEEKWSMTTCAISYALVQSAISQQVIELHKASTPQQQAVLNAITDIAQVIAEMTTKMDSPEPKVEEPEFKETELNV